MLEKDIGKILEATLSSSTDYRLKVSLFSLHLYRLYEKKHRTHIINVIRVREHDIQNLLLQMQSLQNLYEYLLDAESQMGTDNPDNNEVAYSVEGGQSVPVAAGAGDTNICGGIVQLYWESILGRCLDEIELVRRSALKVNLLYQS